MEQIYDLIGIGIGPFNLGLAALAQPIRSFRTLFLEKKKQFSWHEAMMIDGTTLQVPFYADLVTLADPCSQFSFLNFLKAKGRMIRFACNENYYVERKEYLQYCRWVLEQLHNCIFDQEVFEVIYDNDYKCYKVYTQAANGDKNTYYCKHLVIGIGTEPVMPVIYEHPQTLQHFIHSSSYLKHKEALMQKKQITIVGSGQSAAEIFYDLLQLKPLAGYSLEWYTQSAGFFQMETSKLMCELTSPAYIDYFYNLPASKKLILLREHKYLYKGINKSLLDAIYNVLYTQSLEQEVIDVTLQTSMQLTAAEPDVNGRLKLCWKHVYAGKEYQTLTDAVIAASGYHNRLPGFVYPVMDRICVDADGNYVVNRNYSIDQNASEIFIQNAELHTHGFSAPDLGLGPYRNMCILNAVLGYTYFKTEQHTVFQKFG